MLYMYHIHIVHQPAAQRVLPSGGLGSLRPAQSVHVSYKQYMYMYM